MLKLITTEDTDWGGDAPVGLFRFHSRGVEFPKGMKLASELAREFDDLKPEKGRTLVLTLAVGSTERFGPNRNADGFKRADNQKAHPRFVKNGHVYRHHKNKDPSKALGKIARSAYNNEMDRIELILDCDNELCRDELQKMAEGKDVPGSMGCTVSFDVCSICGHQAPSPQDYCFTPDVLITMSDGTLRQIADIKLGDWVLDKDGQATQVTRLFSREVNESVYCLTTTLNGLETCVTGNHPIWTAAAEEGVCLFHKHCNPSFPTCWPGRSEHCTSVCRKKAIEFDFTPASKVRVGDYVASPLAHGACKRTEFDLEDLWVFGLFSAEGSYGKLACDRTGLQFSLHKEETHLIDRLQAYFASKFGKDIKIYGRDQSKGVSVRVHSREIARLFYDICGEYANQKKIHQSIFNATEEEVSAFLSGLMDGDGCFYENYSRLNSASQYLVTQVSYLFSRLGHDVYFSKYVNAGGPTKRSNTHDGWYVVSSFGHKHRTTAVRRAMTETHILGSVESITEKAYAGTVYNIETGSHTYVANGFAVHNCDHAKYALGRILDDGRQVYVDNPDPGYFDWSFVGRPADRIAYGQRMKCASFDNLSPSGADLAKIAGLYLPAEYAREERLRYKRAALAKLCKMEKEIEGTLMPVDLRAGETEEGELGEDDARRLSNEGIAPAMNALHSAQVLLPVKDFLRLISIGNESLEDLDEDVKGELPGIFSRSCPEDLCENSMFDGDGELPLGFGSLIDRLKETFSAGEPLGRRVTISIIRGRPLKKRAAVRGGDPLVEGLAKLYAVYKLAAVSHPANADQPVVARAAVLQHYASRGSR